LKAKDLDKFKVDQNKPATLKVKDASYSVIPTPHENCGELQNIVLLCNSEDGITEKEFTKYFTVQPSLDTSFENQLKAAGIKAAQEPYTPRQQLTNMKMQSLPSGFNTSKISE
jgi:hypothetical protein